MKVAKSISMDYKTAIHILENKEISNFSKWVENKYKEEFMIR